MINQRNSNDEPEQPTEPPAPLPEHARVSELSTVSELAQGKTRNQPENHETEDCQDDFSDCLDLIDRVREESPQCVADMLGEHAQTVTWLDGQHVPRKIGRFEITRQLGSGGFGLVFLAFDPELKREIALKIPRVEALLNDVTRQRFMREAQAAAALQHRNIATIYESGNIGPICYIAGAYYVGGSLDQVIAREAPLDPRLSADLVQKLAEAVQHAHSRGVLHRDLKPSNVLLDTPCSNFPDGDFAGSRTLPNDRCTDDAQADDRGAERTQNSSMALSRLAEAARISDFGLAKLDETGSRLTRSSAFVGTPAYMSPEQASGNVDAIATPADIYGLGAILYELLTGRPPFQDESIVAVLEAVRNREPVPPRSMIADLSRDLEAICLKCLEKEPHRRYRTAAELADDLQRFLDGELILARRISQPERVLRWCRRNPVVSSLASIVVILLLMLATGSSMAAIQLTKAQKATLDSLEQEILAKDQATQSETEAIRALYEARMALASARRNSGLPGQRFDSLQAVDDAARLADRLNLGEEETLRRRNEACAAMALVDLRVDREWPDAPPLSGSAEIGIDAEIERYARLESDGEIVVRSIQDNREIKRLPGLGTANERPITRFSKNGKYLAVSGNDRTGRARIQVWDLTRAGSPVVDEKPFAGIRVGFDFSPVENRVAIIRPAGDLGIADLETGKFIQEIRIAPLIWIQYDPSGKTLVASLANESERVVFIDTETTTAIGDALDHPRTVNHTAWSGDGRLLAAACSDLNVYVWDVARRKLISTCRGHRHAVNRVAFADNDLLMSSALDMSTRLWDPITGEQMLQAAGLGWTFDPADRWLGLSFSGVKVGRWEVAAAREFSTLPVVFREGVFAYSLDYSPGNRLLAVAGQNDGVGIWDVHSRQEVAHLAFEAGDVMFTQDGGALLTGGRGTGIQYWPITTDEDANHLRIGPPERLYKAAYWKSATSATPNATKAVVNFDFTSAAVLDLRSGEQTHVLKSRDIRYHAMSPNGQWIATGTWRDDGVKVWNALTGEIVTQLPIEGSARVVFSPDGKRLVTCAYKDAAVWNVGDWELVHRNELEGYSYRSANFSRDSQTLAISTRTGVKLLDAASGRELVHLTAPGSYAVRCVAFSANGGQLAVGTQEGDVYLWQLDQLRGSLKEFNLDWEQPALIAASNPPPLQVQVDYPDFSSSSDYNSRYGAHLAFDGIAETRWNSAPGDNIRPWIARFWREPRTIRRLIIHQSFDRIEAFRIQRVDPYDGRWRSVSVVQGAEFEALHGDKKSKGENDSTVNPVFDIELPRPIQTCGIRVLVTQASGSTISISEIEFH